MIYSVDYFRYHSDMQALFDLAPVVAFFIAYSLGGIYVATAVLMIAMALLLLADLVRLRRVPPGSVHRGVRGARARGGLGGCGRRLSRARGRRRGRDVWRFDYRRRGVHPEHRS